ncbi:hypothetical protein [Cytobacillus firmus]|uniref:hypothetical protein n=1 Tax=Cytobacillus firmus TaxID=1399 RepID=UPI0021613C02|nr:hypothetical protein [Cytobacillus firmus]MCS0670752.1 hypothetical protein [Cytobacillus firmus]
MSSKLTLIRTREEEIRGSKSEVDADSDKRRRKSGGRVRSWRIFGQEKKKSEGKSPKLAHIRTGEEEIRGSEFEVDADSDSRRGNQRK